MADGRPWRHSTDLGNALLNVHPDHDGVLLVEDAVRQDAQDAGEDCIELGSLLLLILHLQVAAKIW